MLGVQFWKTNADPLQRGQQRRSRSGDLYIHCSYHRGASEALLRILDIALSGSAFRFLGNGFEEVRWTLQSTSAVVIIRLLGVRVSMAASSEHFCSVRCRGRDTEYNRFRQTFWTP
jgi:hypothetical protein